jgi:hypothetical protein
MDPPIRQVSSQSVADDSAYRYPVLTVERDLELVDRRSTSLAGVQPDSAAAKATPDP